MVRFIDEEPRSEYNTDNMSIELERLLFVRWYHLLDAPIWITTGYSDDAPSTTQPESVVWQLFRQLVACVLSPHPPSESCLVTTWSSCLIVQWSYATIWSEIRYSRVPVSKVQCLLFHLPRDKWAQFKRGIPANTLHRWSNSARQNSQDTSVIVMPLFCCDSLFSLPPVRKRLRRVAPLRHPLRAGPFQMIDQQLWLTTLCH